MCADAYSPDVVAVLSDESFRSVGAHQYLVHPCKDCFKIGKMPPVAEMLTCARRLGTWNSTILPFNPCQLRS